MYISSTELTNTGIAGCVLSCFYKILKYVVELWSGGVNYNQRPNFNL